MKQRCRTAAFLLLGLACMLVHGRVQAQGVTSAAMTGRITSAERAGIAGAQVVAREVGTGTEYRVVTREDGRFLLTGMRPGGPYRIAVTALGYAPAERTGIDLALGQTSRFDFTLAPQAVVLETIAVSGDRNPVISSGRTGTATVIGDSTIMRMPTLSRDFTDFVRLTPQISTGGNGTSAGGRNNRYNSIQIDGAVNNDLFGLAASGTPGGQANARPITLEAIQEFQVVIAPFDVRQGGFTGAGINAITKSGQNDFFGSLSYYGRNEDLVGRYMLGDSLSDRVDQFKQSDLAGSFGGPIIRDRAFFFLAGERSRRSAPLNAVAGTATADVTLVQVTELREYLRSNFGYEAGEVGALNLDQGSNNFVARFDVNVSDAHRLTLRHNYVDAVDENLSRSARTYGLGNAGYDFSSTTNSTVAQLNSSLPRGLFNEFRLGYTTIRDQRVVTDQFPRITVESPTGSVVAGPDNFSGQNALDQNILELTNDLTIPLGAHTVVVGTNNEFFSFSNLFVRNPFGTYTFRSMADLRAANPSRYEYSYLLEGGDERAEFPVRRFGGYVQDQWDVTPRLRLTGGIRADLTQLPEDPKDNPQVFEAVGRRTSEVPSGNVRWSPRVGFNWDVRGDRSLQLRGGVGSFSGRTPYVWISNAYGNTGLDYVRFTCSGSRAPDFVADPNNQPRGCAGTAPNEINTVDPNFRQPQVARASFAVDARLPMGFIGTLEALHTRTIHDVLYRNLGVEPVAGEMVEGRQLYRARNFRDLGIGDIIDVTNTDQGYSTSLTAQVQRGFESGWDFSASYTRSIARDVNALSSSQAISNWRFTPTRNDPNNPELARSRFEVPHRILMSGSYQAKFIRRAPTDISFIYVGESGLPFSFLYGNDINMDGSFGNDLVRVPADMNDIAFVQETVGGQVITEQQSRQNLDAFIESFECLREARGEVIQVNSCRQPWSNRFDVRLAQSIPTLRAQTVQFTVDILNFANLLNADWGQSQFVSFQTYSLLRRDSDEPDAQGRYVYRAFTPDQDPFRVSNLGSRYQIQAGVRYRF